MKPIHRLTKEELYRISPVYKISKLISKFWNISVSPKEKATEKKIYKEMKNLKLPNDENATDLGLIQKLSKSFNDNSDNTPIESLVYACLQYGEHLQERLDEVKIEDKKEGSGQYFNEVKDLLIMLIESEDVEKRKEAVEFINSESFNLKSLLR